ncbi:MAG: DUF2459 domain-containing protein [Hyphomonas sp.]|nr:DUF2459 domain-containing protein [Hyphomonas sp.]
MRSIFRILRHFAVLSGCALVALLVVYAGVAWASAAFPKPGRVQALTGAEPAVYACVTTVHADFAMPLDDPDTDWRAELGNSLPQAVPDSAYLLLGWGDAVFFREVLDLKDLTPGRALPALVGRNPSVVRLVPVGDPAGAPSCRLLPIDAAGRKALADHILASLETKVDGAHTELPTPVAGETLLLAKGHWGALNTCNQWASRGLAAAGLPHAAFAPFAFGVTMPLGKETAEGDTGDDQL